MLYSVFKLLMPSCLIISATTALANTPDDEREAAQNTGQANVTHYFSGPPPQAKGRAAATSRRSRLQAEKLENMDGLGGLLDAFTGLGLGSKGLLKKAVTGGFARLPLGGDGTHTPALALRTGGRPLDAVRWTTLPNLGDTSMVARLPAIVSLPDEDQPSFGAAPVGTKLTSSAPIPAAAKKKSSRKRKSFVAHDKRERSCAPRGKEDLQTRPGGTIIIEEPKDLLLPAMI